MARAASALNALFSPLLPFFFLINFRQLNYFLIKNNEEIIQVRKLIPWFPVTLSSFCHVGCFIGEDFGGLQQSKLVHDLVSRKHDGVGSVSSSDMHEEWMGGKGNCILEVNDTKHSRETWIALSCDDYCITYFKQPCPSEILPKCNLWLMAFSF